MKDKIQCPFVPKTIELKCVNCGSSEVNVTGVEQKLGPQEIIAYGLKAVAAIFCHCDHCGPTIAIQKK